MENSSIFFSTIARGNQTYFSVIAISISGVVKRLIRTPKNTLFMNMDCIILSQFS